MIQLLEGQYPQGADLTIMNTFYQYPLKDENGNRMDDFLVLVYKDNQTKEKHYEIIKKPKYGFYRVKDGVPFDGNYNHFFIEKDKVDEIIVPYREIDKTIAKLTGNMDFYEENIRSMNRNENRKLHKIPTIFASDSNIEDYYRYLFGNQFTNNITKITKAFFDIEVDTRYMTGDFVQMGECPINAISFMDEAHDIEISYLLRNPNNPLIQQFENELATGKFTVNDIKKFVEEKVGGWKQKIRFKLDKTDYKIKFFDNEIQLLVEFFKDVHTYKPDFIMSYNGSAFDIEYIIQRIYKLGYEPADIMCDQTWPIKIVKNYIDQKNINDTPERGDYTFISGVTTWIDQMIQYASRRKAKFASLGSIKLDDIGLREAKVRKLDYHHITKNIAMLPWLDYKTFFLYNLFDVVVQKCIETKCNDLEYIFSKCIVNNTSYRKGHRQTIYLINRMKKEFYKLNYIIGNNANKWNEEPEKFLGALVHDPLHTSDYSKMKINGVPIWICDNLQDYDYKSLYPSIIIEFNIAPNTQIGRIIIPNKVYQGENATKIPEGKYSRGGEFIENLVCDNIIEFCKRWFQLAGFKEFMEDWAEYNQKNTVCYSRETYQYTTTNTYYDKKLEQVMTIPVHTRPKLISPIVSLSCKYISPIHIYEPYEVHKKKNEVKQ